MAKVDADSPWLYRGRYVQRDGAVRLEDWNAKPQPVMCNDCGAMVGDMEIHDAWHDAPNTQQMNRTLEGNAMNVEAITVRDPDGYIDLYVFVDGVRVKVEEYTIDAGAGHEWEDWKEHRDDILSKASPAAREVLVQRLSDPPGGNYVEGRGDEPWLDDE